MFWLPCGVICTIGAIVGLGAGADAGGGVVVGLGRFVVAGAAWAGSDGEGDGLGEGGALGADALGEGAGVNRYSTVTPGVCCETGADDGVCVGDADGDGLDAIFSPPTSAG